MLVCWRWHVIILSVPGVHSPLRIRKATQKAVVHEFIQGRKTRLGVIVDVNDSGDGNEFDAANFRACLMAAIQAASRWSSLNIISPPPYGQYRDLEILQPLTYLESLKLACAFDEFLEPLSNAISRSTLPNLTTMGLADPAAVICLAQPACLHIYHSLSTLKLQLIKRMDSPADILPYLHRLETFEACRLHLPIYPPDCPLSLTHTLRFLYLKSVSVQWMAGHAFPALQKCRIIYPHHADTIDLQPVTMPSCSSLLYHSNNLRPLTQFHLPLLDALDVENAQWNVWRGNTQLVSLCPIIFHSSQSLNTLRLDIKCSGWLLVKMLNLAPALEELRLGLSDPNALPKAFVQAFIAKEHHVDGVSEMVAPPSQTIAPICPLLKLLHLHFKIWTRFPNKKALVVALGDIVGSRQLEMKSSFSLRLSFDEAPEGSHWTIGKPVNKIQNFQDRELILGISTLHAIVPMSTLLPERGPASLLVPFETAESLHVFACDSTSLEFLFIRDHMELVVYGSHRPPLPSSLPHALPLFDALRVLVIKCDNPSFLAGHTFHKLERCWLRKRGVLTHNLSQRLSTETGMPVCTRVNIDDPWVLAAFKVPHIRELALDFSDPNCSVIWEKHIAVNANLSRLNLLHMKNWSYGGNLIPILRSVPCLETLIITTVVGVDSFSAFLPMDADGTTRMKRTSGEGKTLAVLCPRLQHLRIECESLLEQPDLIPFAKDIVTLRAECGSPLKTFTLSETEYKSKFELIGWGGGFNVHEIILTTDAENFKLDM